ncbi:MAG: glycosyl hydrolase [Planctomycetota bacterium]|nr:glycosyl hydrolase [Planctomycetota bacterium]
MRRAILTLAIMAGLSVVTGPASAQGPSDALEGGFADPPGSAKPRTWWHWTGGNVTKEGITKDLEWMKRVGIGGCQLADVSFGFGQTVEEKIEFGSPEWLDAVGHAASEAQRLGLEMAIFSSAGWSETGGPWVKPEQAMKKLVWSEATVEGPRHFTGKLPQPPSCNGPFQNIGAGGRGPQRDPTWYGDSAVIAFRTPQAEVDMVALNPKVTTSAGDIDAGPLFDDDWNSAATIRPPSKDAPAWLQIEFAQPFRARAITIAGPAGIPVGRVLAGDDVEHLRTLVTLPGAQLYRQGRIRTFALPETTAKIYRIEMTAAPLGPGPTMSQEPTPPAQQYSLTEVRLHSGARVHRWEDKAGFSHLFEYETVPTPDVHASTAIRRSEVIDLTSKMSSDGTLDWDVPAGKWTILRMGSSLTGAKNQPAPPSGSGYEADKLSAKHMEAYYHGYFDPLAKALGPLFGKSLRYVLMDSWEAGRQNWTQEMIGEFWKRRGYDPTPYLAILTGRVVESAEASDRFLWDFRRTLADMWADYHYGVMADLLDQHGIGIYGEAAGVSLEIPEDTLLNKSKVAIPMGEFWVGKMHPPLMYYQDMRGAASASHVYGKTLVAAESFTGGGYETPLALKRVSDYWFAQGLNRIVFHTSAHQPLDTRPGNAMVGTHIHRNITWAEQAGPFVTYLARQSFLLQQGLFVADLAYLLDEGAPSTMPIWGAGLTPKPPEGYDFDYVNADVLLNRMSVGPDGRLMLPDGMSYRVLVLPQTDKMRPELLGKIRDLVLGGAVVVGPKPVRSPSLMGFPDADRQVRTLAAEVWGDLDGVSRTVRYVGKGRVVWGLPLEDVLASLNTPKDVEFAKALDADIVWTHRHTPNADIYYIANLTDATQEVQARFRISGREAELWHPDTGQIEPASYRIVEDRTIVPLHLSPRESLFVVFRRDASSLTCTLPQRTATTLATVNGPWDVTFPANLGAPERIQLAHLESWTAHVDPGVKYFSGTATYTRMMQAPQGWFRSGTRLALDLGTVHDIAEVSINGEPLATLWKPPYRVDVTDLLKPGENRLEIKVTNQWTNRQIGDRLVPPDQKVLAEPAGGFGPMAGFGGPQTPAESGLLGPVTIVSTISQ